MARVLVSAAHTLENPGEIFQDLREADITRKILKKTIPYLEQLKIEFQAVPLDLQLLQRIDWINNTGYTEEQGDVLVEIHVNDGGKRGIEGWFKGAADPTNKSQKLTETIVNGICKYTGYQSQGAKSEYEHDLGALIILNQINPIGTAVECLFIDNLEDIAIIKDEQKLDQLAKAIADSINDYVKGTPQTQPVPATQAPTPVQPPLSATPFSPAPVAQTSPVSPFPSPMTNFSSGFGGGRPSMFGNSAATGGNKPLLMDREERKEMIKKTYKKILGKEPNQNDLNLHLNTGASEADLIKKLLEGPEHEKMVKDAGELKETRDKFEKLDMEVARLNATVNDQRTMQNSMNQLLNHKNAHIAKLQQELARYNIIPSGQHIDSSAARKTQNEPTSGNPKGKKAASSSLAGRLMKMFKI